MQSTLIHKRLNSIAVLFCKRKSSLEMRTKSMKVVKFSRFPMQCFEARTWLIEIFDQWGWSQLLILSPLVNWLHKFIQ